MDASNNQTSQEGTRMQRIHHQSASIRDRRRHKAQARATGAWRPLDAAAANLSRRAERTESPLHCTLRTTNTMQRGAARLPQDLSLPRTARLHNSRKRGQSWFSWSRPATTRSNRARTLPRRACSHPARLASGPPAPSGSRLRPQRASRRHHMCLPRPSILPGSAPGAGTNSRRGA